MKLDDEPVIYLGVSGDGTASWGVRNASKLDASMAQLMAGVAATALETLVQDLWKNCDPAPEPGPWQKIMAEVEKIKSQHGAEHLTFEGMSQYELPPIPPGAKPN